MRRDRLRVDAQGEQCRPPGAQSPLEGAREVLSALDGLAVGAERPRVGGEVRVLEFDQTGLAKVQKLISLDELELTVVEDNPDDILFMTRAAKQANV